MTKEKSLSEKIIPDCDLCFPVLDVDDVKEAVLKLKNFINNTTPDEYSCYIIETINKIFGEELSQ